MIPVVMLWVERYYNSPNAQERLTVAEPQEGATNTRLRGFWPGRTVGSGDAVFGCGRLILFLDYQAKPFNARELIARGESMSCIGESGTLWRRLLTRHHLLSAHAVRRYGSQKSRPEGS
jgi:hypothetical protein